MRCHHRAVAVFLVISSLVSSELIPSRELSEEETDILEELRLGKQEHVLKNLFQPMTNELEKSETVLNSLLKIQQEMIPQLEENTALLETQYEEIRSTYDQLQQNVEKYNQQKILDFYDRIKLVIKEELERREVANIADDEGDMNDSISSEKILKIDMEAKMNVDSMLNNSQSSLEHHISTDLMEGWRQILEEYNVKCAEEIEGREFFLGRKATRLEKGENVKKNGSCLDLVDVGDMLLEKLSMLANEEKQKDALVGATVVYGGDWTSDTFHPELLPEPIDDDESLELKLGDVSLRKYFPQDWEKLLPDGWENYDISVIPKVMNAAYPQNILPPSFWHSLPKSLNSIFQSPFSKGVPSPPETVLDVNTMLGSCWKMAGGSGIITLKLVKPTILETITIQHYPWIPSAHKSDEYMNHLKSAPKRVRVKGYAACPADAKDTKNDCETHTGFDTSNSMTYESVEFKIDTSALLDEDEDVSYTKKQFSSKQTFKLNPAALVMEEFDGDSSESEGGCSATKPTCDASTEMVAISIIIEENWGNPDYTCLYRLMVNEKE